MPQVVDVDDASRADRAAPAPELVGLDEVLVPARAERRGVLGDAVLRPRQPGDLPHDGVRLARLDVADVEDEDALEVALATGLEEGVAVAADRCAVRGIVPAVPEEAGRRRIAQVDRS